MRTAINKRLAKLEKRIKPKTPYPIFDLDDYRAWERGDTPTERQKRVYRDLETCVRLGVPVIAIPDNGRAMADNDG